MSLIDNVMAQINAIDPQPFALVEGAADLAAIDGNPTVVPTAYVFIKEEAAEENTRATGPVLQRCENDIAVVIITSNVADATGSAALTDVEALKLAVRSALVGFVPASGAGEPVEYLGARVLRFRSGYVWIELVFSVASYIEESS